MVTRPLAEASRLTLGKFGPALMTIAALLSILGYLMATTLSAPRMLYALAESRHMPAVLAQVHPRFRTPYISVLVYVALVWILTVFGSFRWGVFFSAVTRLVVYVAVCICVFVFRRRAEMIPGMRVAGAPLFAAIAIAFCVLMATRMGLPELLILVGTLLPAAITWQQSEKRSRPV
jgi:amino acid transporter